jgi:hypothetical protein
VVFGGQMPPTPLKECGGCSLVGVCVARYNKLFFNIYYLSKYKNTLELLGITQKKNKHNKKTKNPK